MLEQDEAAAPAAQIVSVERGSPQVGGVTRNDGTSQNPPRNGTSRAEIGRQIFFDTNLSEPTGQACASCHQPDVSFTDPRGGPTSRGAVAGRAGFRNTPSIFYAALIPPLHEDGDTFVGGLFLDGRAGSLEAQAAGPFTNPIEMNNASPAAVMAKVRRSSYAAAFAQVFGASALSDDRAGFQAVTQALAAFERESDLQRFSSKFDQYLAGRTQLSAAERRGLALFEGKGKCSACHPTTPDPNNPRQPPLLTDFTYDNIGIPRNPSNPFYSVPSSFNPSGSSYVDHGLRTTVGRASEDGKFRVPTLRNVARTAPYGHNGYFATLRSVVDFYNTRDVRAWPAPEVPATVNREELGNLGLTNQEVDDIVSFLNTLTDQ